MINKLFIYHKYQRYLSYILEKLIYLYDKDTGLHIKRIKLYSKLIAKELNCSKEFISEIELVSSLHDIGKIFISKKILNKEGKLTEIEFKKMKKHSLYGKYILTYLKFGDIAKNIAEFHHEHFNGKGYPHGLKGEEIPIEARIVSLVDIYDALRQKRCYKDALPHEQTLEILKNLSGDQLDIKVVDSFLKNQYKFNKIFEKFTIHKKSRSILSEISKKHYTRVDDEVI